MIQSEKNLEKKAKKLSILLIEKFFLLCLFKGQWIDLIRSTIIGTSKWWCSVDMFFLPPSLPMAWEGRENSHRSNSNNDCKLLANNEEKKEGRKGGNGWFYSDFQLFKTKLE